MWIFQKLQMFCVIMIISSSLAFSQTIADKRLELVDDYQENQHDTDLNMINHRIKMLRVVLFEKHEFVNNNIHLNVNNKSFKSTLVEINHLRRDIKDLENQWHEITINENIQDQTILVNSDSALLSQLIMEYGSDEYLYVIPPEILSMKIQINCGLPILKESFNDLLEIILSNNGIGIHQLNSYTRQLYLLKQSLAGANYIVNSRDDLQCLSSNDRLIYVFSTKNEEISGVSHLFERFRNQKITFIYQIGSKLIIVSSKKEIQKLLKLYDSVFGKNTEKITRIVSLNRLGPQKMETILNASFSNAKKNSSSGLIKNYENDVIIIPLEKEGSLAIIGPRDAVEHAVSIVEKTEKQMEDPAEMIVYSYQCRHSDPIDMSNMLERVYKSLITNHIGILNTESNISPKESNPKQIGGPPPPDYGPPPYSSVVEPLPVIAGTIRSQEEQSHTSNFIPDSKTGAIMMVIRRDTLDKIKYLIQTLDVPKKMVQIEVLLFEKRMKNQNDFGLNLLRLGSSANKGKSMGLDYETGSGNPHRGIVDFFVSRPKPSFIGPAFDMAYHFFMAQEDVRINAAPSITTLNQTPAQISLVTELSIDNGAAPIDSNQGTAFQKSYSRAQYGTTMVITPTIHESNDNNDYYITLDTNISFDTIKKNTQEDRPSVSRRHIENQVRVIDGETVVLGGLREKLSEDAGSKIPFLGEIPGLSKFFGESRMTDENTEMFIFITPKIVFDTHGEYEELRKNSLLKRPGDIPEFLSRVLDGKSAYKKRLFNNSIRLMFGNVDE